MIELQFVVHVGLVLRPTWFAPFCFKAPRLYTQLLKLRSLIFDLTSFGWLLSIKLNTT